MSNLSASEIENLPGGHMLECACCGSWYNVEDILANCHKCADCYKSAFIRVEEIDYDHYDHGAGAPKPESNTRAKRLGRKTFPKIKDFRKS